MDVPLVAAGRLAPQTVIRVEGLHEKSSEPYFFGYVGNISESGLFVQTARPRPVGTVLRLRLHSRSLREEPIDCNAEVIWNRGYSGVSAPSMGVGLRFQDLDVQAAAVLRSFCGRSGS